ncbi:unnamed protein product [Amoebophrya sp. A120]|nr:unnamed protein product [Amoebophrya sp. A120]|eukprot:GSA120T00007705001.1
MTAVTLHVYDLTDQAAFCCGFFHTGVVVNNVEWSFGSGGGITGSSPGLDGHSVPDGCRFREAILLGYIDRNSDISRALDRLRPEFQGNSYHLVFKNCNDFSRRFYAELFQLSGREVTGKENKFPNYINRLAWWGRQWPICKCVPGNEQFDPGRNGGAANSGSNVPPTRPLIATNAFPRPDSWTTGGGPISSSSGRRLGDRSTASSARSTSASTTADEQERSLLSRTKSALSSLFGRGRASEEETQPTLGGGNATATGGGGTNAREVQAKAAEERSRLAENRA